MIVLKEVKHYPDTNSIEATWVDRSIAPDTLDEDSAVTDVQIKCHSYADVQMAMFRADIAERGGDIAEYESLIALVESGIKPPVPPTVEGLIAAAKAERQVLVNAITVTTVSGKTFDGDEVAQGRMSRAINALDAGETTLWILANGVVDLNVTREELREALRLAGAAQTAVWAAPYTL